MLMILMNCIIVLLGCPRKVSCVSALYVDEDWVSPSYTAMDVGFHDCNANVCTIAKKDIQVLIHNQALCDHVRSQMLDMIILSIKDPKE